MALVHPDASISPSKPELLEAWVPTQPWGAGGLSGGRRLPVRRPGRRRSASRPSCSTAPAGLLQVPLTYRSAPLEGVEPITTMTHTVLGDRWIYDGLLDPVAVAAFVTAALTGGTQAAVEHDDADGTHHVREPTVHVTGSGVPGSGVPGLGALSVASDERTTTVTSGPVELVLARVVPLPAASGGAVLTGTWPGQEAPALLASVLTG